MKGNNFKRFITALMVTLLIVPITSASGCKLSAPKLIKPDVDSNQSGAITSNESNQVRSSLSETQAQELELKKIQYYNLMQTINDACAGYQFGFGVLPEKMEDLIDGFMVFWPGCPYNDKPMMIMGSIPDPQNSEHVGKIFYERLNNLQAKIYYLDVDVEKSQAGQLVWKVIEHNVELFYNPDDLNPDGSIKMPPGAPSLPYQEPEKKFLNGFRQIFYLKIEQLTIDYLHHFGTINTSFQDMLTSRKYFVLEKGSVMLNKYVSEGNVEFDMGVVGDGSHYYYDRYNYNIITGNSKCYKACVRVDTSFQSSFTGASLYDVKTSIDCPEFGPNSKSILNSKEPSTYHFSDDLLITGDEVIYH